MNRVAITGIGVISCLGNDIGAVAESLRRGKSGIRRDEKRLAIGFRSPLTGLIEGFDAEKVLPKKQRKTMPDFAVWAYAAARDALNMSGLEDRQIRSPATGLIFGCDSSCVAAVEQVESLRAHGETKSIGSGLIFRSMTSTVTMNLNVIFGTQGASWSISSACSSGGHAVGQAADLIAMGKQERVICGGVQEINWESMCSFDGLGAFSIRSDDPAAASRPFDADRDGLIPSGGAAALVLERWDLASARGAPILGEVRAYAFSSDGRHLSIPSGEGLGRAMAAALRQAGLKTGDVDYICAHATSTPAGDAAEAEAVKSLFAGHQPWISSLKSMTGHELWMAGASQAVYAVIMAREEFIAPNINFNRPDESSAGLRIVTETVPMPPRVVLCNSAGFGGTNSCLILVFRP